MSERELTIGERIDSAVVSLRSAGERAWTETEGNAPRAFGRLEAYIEGIALELVAISYAATNSRGAE